MTKKEEAVVDVSSKFSFKNLALNDQGVWTLRLIIAMTMSEAYRKYHMRFTHNDAPYLREI